MERIDELLADYQPFHTTIQMRAFITGRSGLGSTWGMYCQALRELKKRRDDLRQMEVGHRRTLATIAELKGWRRRALDFITGRRAFTILKLQELELSLIESVPVEADVRREFDEFFAQADMFKSELGEITPEVRDRLDREQWAISLRVSSVMELLVNGQVGTNTLEFLMAAPVAIRTEVLTASRSLGLSERRVNSLRQVCATTNGEQHGRPLFDSQEYLLRMGDENAPPLAD